MLPRRKRVSLKLTLALEAPVGHVGLAVPSSQSPAHRAPALSSLIPVLTLMGSWQAGHPQVNCGTGWSSCITLQVL